MFLLKIYDKYTMHILKKTTKHKNISKRIYYILISALVINLVLVLFSLWTNLNIFQLDMIGHFASWTFFKNIGMHQFNDTRFLGYINNLFYPPLEDLLSTLISYSTHNWLIAFKILLSIVLSWFLFSLILISKRFKYWWAKNTFLFAAIILLNLDKSNTVYQGLSYFDILFTWLTSQFLGATFLFLLIYVLLWKNKHYYLLIFLLWFATIMSHLVIAPVAALLVTLFSIIKKDIKLIFVGIWILLSSAFFIIPFALSQGFMTSARIITNIPILVSICTAISLWLAIRSKNKKYITIAIAAVFLVTLNIIAYLWHQRNLDFIPAFHYYRFYSIAILLWLIAMIGVADIIRQKKQIKFKRISITILSTIIITTIVIAKYLWIFWIKKYQQYINNNTAQIQNIDILNTINDGKRIFTISPHRAVDSNLDAYIATLWYNLHFVKGLFWESNLSNTLISSYIAMLLNNENIVTNHIESQLHDCWFIKKLRDTAISNLAIWRFIISPIDTIKYLDTEKKICYKDIIKNWTNNFYWTKKWEFNANNIDYSVFKITAKSWQYNDMVLAYKNSIIKKLNINEKYFYGNIFADAFSESNNTGTKILYSLETIWEENTDQQMHINTTNDHNTIKGSFEKIKNEEYKISIPWDQDLWFTISLNYFPWFKLYTEDWTQLELFRWNQYMISKWHWTMILKYTKPKYFSYLYILSILSFLISLILFSQIQHIPKRLKIMS